MYGDLALCREIRANSIRSHFDCPECFSERIEVKRGESETVDARCVDCEHEFGWEIAQ